MPCLIASRTQGLWVLTRGRRVRPAEALRCLGIDAAAYTWPDSRAEACRLAGNAMSRPVVEAVIRQVLKDIDFDVQDPGGERIAGRAEDLPAPPASGALPGHQSSVPRPLRATGRGVQQRGRRVHAAAAKGGTVFADIFCSGGGISPQVEALGFRAVRWDAKFGSQHDVCLAGPRRDLTRMIQSGAVFAALLTPAWKPGCRDRESVRAVLDLAGALTRAEVPWILAAAACADAWQDSGIGELALLPRTHNVTCDLCRFGARARGRTRLLCSGFDGLDCQALASTCAGCGGWCSATRRQHARAGSIGSWPGSLKRRLATIVVSLERANFTNVTFSRLNVDAM